MQKKKNWIEKKSLQFFIFFCRYSGTFADNLSIHTNQSSINGGGSSYVDYARDYYSPTIQNANNCLLQMQRETPTYV